MKLSHVCPFLILLFFGLISLLTLPWNPLLNDDASFYALAIKNCVTHGQWFAQYLTPSDPTSFLDKPPLGIWALSLPTLFLGVNELWVHVANVLYGIFFVGIFYGTLVRLGLKKISGVASGICATSLAFLVYSRSPKLEILLTITVWLAGVCLFRLIKTKKPVFFYGLATATVAGFLIKSG